MLLASDDRVTLDTVQLALPAASATAVSSANNSGSLADRVQNFERDVILG